MLGVGIGIGVNRFRAGDSYAAMKLDGLEFDNGKLVMGFDDGWDSWYTDGLAIFEAQGVKFTGYINGASVGVGAEVLTWAQTKALINAGHDIQCHGYEGTILESMTDQEIEDNYTDQNATFESESLNTPIHTAYSVGSYNQNAIDILDDYRVTGRTTRLGFTNRKSSKFEINSRPISGDREIDLVKEELDFAKANNVAMILYGHSMKTEPSYPSLENTAAYLNEIIDYAQSIGVDIITMKELYEQMLYIDLRVSREGLADDEVDLTFNHVLDSSYSVSIERSDDGGDTYSEILESAAGVTYYQDSGLTSDTIYYYRVRAVKDGAYLPYSREANISTPVTMVLSATGTGLGITKFEIASNQNMTVTLDGTGKFYSDAAGTLDESSSLSLVRQSITTIYIRVPSGTSNMVFPFNDLWRWEKWESATNAPSIAGDISKFPSLTFLALGGNNTVSGDLSKMVNLKDLSLSNGATCGGALDGMVLLENLTLKAAALTCTIDVSNMIYLETIQITSVISITGSITNLVNLTSIKIGVANTISGSIDNITGFTYIYLQGSNTISGSITALSDITYLRVGGSNTLSGSIENMSSLTFVLTSGANEIAFDLNDTPSSVYYLNLNPNTIASYTQGHDWSHITSAFDIRPAVGYGLSSAEVDNLLIDMDSSGMSTGTSIYITGSCEARTSASDTAVSNLTTAGMTVFTN